MMDGDGPPRLPYGSRWSFRTPSPDFALRNSEPISPSTPGPAMDDATTAIITTAFAVPSTQEPPTQEVYPPSNQMPAAPIYPPPPPAIDNSWTPFAARSYVGLPSTFGPYERPAQPIQEPASAGSIDPLRALAEFALSTAPAEYHKRSRSPVAQPAPTRHSASPTFTEATMSGPYPSASASSYYDHSNSSHQLPSLSSSDELPPIRSSSSSTSPNIQKPSLPSVNGLVAATSPIFPDNGRSKRHKSDQADIPDSTSTRDEVANHGLGRRASTSSVQTNGIWYPRGLVYGPSVPSELAVPDAPNGLLETESSALPARLPTPPLPEPTGNDVQSSYRRASVASDRSDARPQHPWINTSPIDDFASRSIDDYDDHTITVKRPDPKGVLSNGSLKSEVQDFEMPTRQNAAYTELSPEVDNHVKSDDIAPLSSLPTPTQEDESGTVEVLPSKQVELQADEDPHVNLTPEEQAEPMEVDDPQEGARNIIGPNEMDSRMNHSDSGVLVNFPQFEQPLTVADSQPEPRTENALIENNYVPISNKNYEEPSVSSERDINEHLGATMDDKPVLDADGDITMGTEVITESSTLPLPVVVNGTSRTPVHKKGSKQRSRTQSTSRDVREPARNDEYCGTCKIPYNQVENEAQGDNGGAWIECDGCKGWHHGRCVGLDQMTMEKIDKFYCQHCQPLYGPSTMKRTSSRSHTAIDYNALHNGSSIPIKNPVDSKIHPYVNRIREKTFDFAPEKLARLHPDAVTTQYLDSVAWSEPFIVPAHLNEAPWHRKNAENALRISEQEDLVNPRPKTPPANGKVDRNGSPIPAKKRHSQSRRTTPEKRPSDSLDIETSAERSGADDLDMIIPEALTVRRVAELISESRPVEMINVLSQSSSQQDKWSMGQLVDYFESSTREAIYNCISCEVTGTELGNMISRPKVVRDMDLVERVWDRNKDPKPPTVGKYVLMSVADSFTDFHIDFAGSSVFYHIYEGQKVFLVMPPTDKNLEAYEKWSVNPQMNATWLPSLTEDKCMLVTLNKGDTMFIPSGWIHAVHTPVDSLVIGGNFLTRNQYVPQLKVQDIEVRTGVKISQRYPRFTTLMWYCVFKYLTSDALPVDIDEALARGEIILRGSKVGDRPTYTRQELEGLPTLCNWLYRVTMIALGVHKAPQKSVDALKKTIPEEFRSDPLAAMKSFARWCIYQRAFHKIAPEGEKVPEWALTGWQPSFPQKHGHQKPAPKVLEEELKKAQEPRRQGLRERQLKSNTPVGDTEAPPPPPPLAAPKPRSTATPASAQRKKKPTEVAKPDGGADDRALHHEGFDDEGERFLLSDGSIYVKKLSNLGPPRAGCQNCRQKKTGCKHKDEIAKILNGQGKPAPAPRPKSGAHKTKAKEDRPPQLPAKVNEPQRINVDQAVSIARPEARQENLPVKTPPPKTVPKAPVPPKPVPAPLESTPKTVEDTATNSSSSNGPPPGFKGRKPSCDECKALKKKCPHEDTWKLLNDKQAVRDSRKAIVQHQKVHRRMHKEARRKQAVPSNASFSTSGPREEEGHSIVVNSSRAFRPNPSQDAAPPPPPPPPAPLVPPAVSSSPNAPRVKESSGEPEGFDLPVLDTSILNDAPVYESRVATTTPEDPSIMAPPIDDFDELNGRPAQHRSSSTGDILATKNGPKSPTGQPVPRTKKSKIIYTSTTKTIKRKAEDDGSNSANKAARASPASSPGSSKSAAAEEDMTQPELERVMRQAALGLRDRRTSTSLRM